MISSDIIHNAERLLELQMFGWTTREPRDISSAFQLQPIVDRIAKKIHPPNKFHFPKPTPSRQVDGRGWYNGKIAKAMNSTKIKPYYGELYCALLNHQSSL